MTFKKVYHKPLPFLKTCFIKCTTKKMAKRKGNKTMSNTVQRLRKKYPQRLRDHHEFFSHFEKGAVPFSDEQVIHYRVREELRKKSSLYYFTQQVENLL